MKFFRRKGLWLSRRPVQTPHRSIWSGHSNEVRLLLTDITMPGKLNGADLANQFGDRWPDKPIMIMSGFETPESSGVRHQVSFIKKPWALGQLLDCVQRLP